MNQGIVRIVRNLLVVSGFTIAACSGNDGPGGLTGDVQVIVDSLTLAAVQDACYDLTVSNADGSVTWTENVCASRYGAGASLSYVGPCDAEANPNTVSLTLNELIGDDGVPMDDFANPCPADAPCTQVFQCQENEDVQVSFDLTLMRSAEQGFFDIAVNFEDVFCSAKLDCLDDNGAPIDLLHDPETGDRVPTAVLAVACTAGVDETTHLYMSDITIECALGNQQSSIVIDPTHGPGNFYGAGATAPAGLIQVATYRGVEDISIQNETADKIYQTVAIAPDLDLPPGPTPQQCRLHARATATEHPATQQPGGFGIAASYPIIVFDVPLLQRTQANVLRFACERHPLNGADGRVAVAPAPAGSVLAHEILTDSPPAN